MKNIMMVIPTMTDATSLYRGVGPMAHLKKKRPDINLTFVSEVNWAVLRMTDVVFMQRPFNDDHMTIARMAKDQHIPLWIDYDDDLFSVPSDNPTHKMYSQERIKKNVATIIAMADHVTVSTDFLKRKITSLNKNITVVKNALDSDMFRRTEEQKKSRNKLAMWRGSNTHMRDLMTVAGEICESMDSHPSWTFHFQGYNPWFITEGAKNAVVGAAVDIVQYFQLMQKIRPSIMMVPLADSDFNRSKSNIAWLEGAFAGSVTIAPEFDEWKVPGCFTYKEPHDFARVFKEVAMLGDDVLNQQSEMAWEYVQDCLTLDTVNKGRSDVLNSLL